MLLNDYCTSGRHIHTLPPCNFVLNTIYGCQWIKDELMVLPDVTQGNNVMMTQQT